MASAESSKKRREKPDVEEKEEEMEKRQKGKALFYDKLEMPIYEGQPVEEYLLPSYYLLDRRGRTKDEVDAAKRLFVQLQNPYNWPLLHHILSTAQKTQSKICVLTVLDGLIEYNWTQLPSETRDQIKSFIFVLMVKHSTGSGEEAVIDNLNLRLLQILKEELDWLGIFLHGLFEAAKARENIFANCISILSLLSKEVLNLSKDEMTREKVEDLKQSLNREFQLILKLLLYVLSKSQCLELRRATLTTMLAFIPWIPLDCIFKSSMLETLFEFFLVHSLQNLTLQCLTEVVSQNPGDSFDLQYCELYETFMSKLQIVLPTSTNIPQTCAHGSNDEKAFLMYMALFFTSFYKSHFRVLESKQERALLMGLEYLINISTVDDTEVFQVCLKYFHSFVSGLSKAQLNQRQHLVAPLIKLRSVLKHHLTYTRSSTVKDENGNLGGESMGANNMLICSKVISNLSSLLDHQSYMENLVLLMPSRVDWVQGRI